MRDHLHTPTTSTGWSHFKVPRWGHCKLPLRCGIAKGTVSCVKGSPNASISRRLVIDRHEPDVRPGQLGSSESYYALVASCRQEARPASEQLLGARNGSELPSEPAGGLAVRPAPCDPPGSDPGSDVVPGSAASGTQATSGRVLAAPRRASGPAPGGPGTPKAQPPRGLGRFDLRQDGGVGRNRTATALDKSPLRLVAGLAVHGGMRSPARAPPPPTGSLSTRRPTVLMVR